MPKLKPNPRYWTHDTALFEGQFRYFGDHSVMVRGKIHVAEEPYQATDLDQALVALTTTQQGIRISVQMKPFALLPPDRLRGTVVSSQERKKWEVELGNAQAWYYPQEKTIVIGECVLKRSVRDHLLPHDPNMRALWTGFERLLRNRFVGFERLLRKHAPRRVPPYAEAERIIIHAPAPRFEREEYQEFLTALGYIPISSTIWEKRIERA